MKGVLNQAIGRFTLPLRESPVLIVFLIFMLLLTVRNPAGVKSYLNYVDWKTVSSLYGLLVITDTIKISGAVDRISLGILKRFKSERWLSISILALSLILPMFLTNDIALFVLIPISLSIEQLLNVRLERILILEIIAVNVGSMLTPIGNPQNLFLWHHWGISFINFVSKLFPVFLISSAILLAAGYMLSGQKRIESEKLEADIPVKVFLLTVSISALITFVIMTDFGFHPFALLLIILVYLAVNPKSLLDVDWKLLITISLMFIDIHLIQQIEPISRELSHINAASPSTVFLSSIALSQFISNVPASILISGYSHNWQQIAYGTNVGGNGTVIASLANLIGIKLAGKHIRYPKFQLYSFAFLLTSCLAIYIMLYTI